MLDDTTALVHLLVHLNKDRFQRLLAYADIARVIAGGGVDWERAERFARGEGITVSTFRTLGVVLDELSLPWPEELASGWVSCVDLERDLAPGIRLRGIEGRLRFRRRQDWIALLARGRTREALRWWFREMWPPAPVVAVRYAEIRGPYLWKLFRGRFNTARTLRATLGTRSPHERSTTRRTP